MLNKLDEYVPYNAGQATKLERELGRLQNNNAIPIGVLGVDSQHAHRPLSSRRFFKLDNTCSLEDVKAQIRTLKPETRERKVWNPNVRSSTPPGMRQTMMDEMAIEDHVRDFEYASAQLQAARSRELCLQQEGNPFFGTEDPRSRDPGYDNGWYGESTMGRVDSDSRSSNRGRHFQPSDKWQDDEFFRSSHDEILPIPAQGRAEHQRHLAPPNSGPYANQNSGYSSFFESEDDDMDLGDGHLSLRRSGAITKADAMHARLRQNISGPDAMKQQLSASRSPSPSRTSHSMSRAASAHDVNGILASSSAHGSPHSSPLPTRRALNESFDSDDNDSQRSKDSGYDSGGSFEGFEDVQGGGRRGDELDDDDDDDRRRIRPAKVPEDDEANSSRLQHVPETRLRTRPAAADQTSTPAPPDLQPSESSTNLARIPPGTPSKTPGTHTPVIVAPTPTRATARTGSITATNAILRSDSSVQPLLAPGAPMSRNQDSANEVQMTRFDTPNGKLQRGRSGSIEDSSDIPGLLPVPNGHANDSPSSPQDDHLNLSFGDHADAAPPRTTFYHLPDPRKLNRKKAIKDLQNGFSELYRGLHLLKRYAELNVEATDKILAKYEKHIARGHRLPFMRHEISNFNFSKSQELRLLISQTEYVYAQAFTGGHRTPAMQKLRVPEEEEDMEATTLRFGLLFGMSLGFMIIIVYMMFVVQSVVVQKMRPDLIVFRMLFIATLLTWYWGVDMWIWAKHRVNYPFIFEFNTRGHMRYQNIFDIASVFTVILIGDMMLYMLSALQKYDQEFKVPGFEFLKHVPPELYPLLIVLFMLFLCILYSVRSGFWLLRTLGRIVTAPLFKVVFRDFFLADQLVSISLMLQDIDFTICYFATSAFRGGGNSCATNHVWMSAILSTIPQLWRLLQCFRRYYDSKDKTNLHNAGKYTTGMLVAITSSLRSTFSGSQGWLGTWLFFVIIATVYSYAWDIYKDWSIGDPRSVNWMLRDQLLYPKWWYYAAALVNLILRLMWTLTISPDSIAAVFFLGRDGFTTLLVAVEISRRAMWNIFRLENEQLNNCGRFRAVQDIPLPLPLKPAVEEKLYQDKIQ